MHGTCAFPKCQEIATNTARLAVPKHMQAFIDFPGEFDFGTCEKHAKGQWITEAHKESILEINARMKGVK